MSEVSVVILNLNGRPYLEECLSSVRRLTVPVEVVVADNGSQDGSAAYVRESFPEARVRPPYVELLDSDGSRRLLTRSDIVEGNKQ